MYRNMHGSVEFLELQQVPPSFRQNPEAYLDVRHGFVGLIDAENCAFLLNKRARIQLYNIYPEGGEQALVQQCNFLGAIFESWIDGTWQFVVDMV